MNMTTACCLNLLGIIAFIQLSLPGSLRGQILADSSGTLLAASAEPVSYPALSKELLAAVTLQEAVTTSPFATESFSTIQYAPAIEPALVLPVTPVFGPGQSGFVAMTGPESDPLVPFQEVSAVPEPSTWCATAFAATTIVSAFARRTARHRERAFKA
jgi:hypothetical protein